LLDRIYDLGINSFDTARNYGLSEKSLGKWLKNKKREDVIVLSKGGHPGLLGNKRISEKEINKDLNRSLELLQTDYIDIYLLHRDDTDKNVSEIVDILNKFYKEGKIKAFGGSNWTYQRIKEANEYALGHNLVPFTFSSPNYGLARQVNDPWGFGCVSLSGDKEAIDWYIDNQMPIIAYSSLARGFFSGKVSSLHPELAKKILDKNAYKGYVSDDNFERLRRCEQLSKEKNCTVARLALAYIFNQKMNTFSIVSASNKERMEGNIKSLDIVLNEEELKWLDLQPV